MARNQKTYPGRIALLRLMAFMELEVKESSASDKRRHYVVRRRRGWCKKTLQEKCWVCRVESKHRHHVIPLKNGGRNIKKNIVPLCVSCHKAVHAPV